MPENYLDQRTIAKWRKDTEQYEPLSPIKDGYIMDAAGETLLLRVVLRSEAERLGMKGISPEVGYSFVNRIANQPAVEEAALIMQRDRFLLRREMAKLLTYLQTKTLPPDRVIAEAARIYRETE